MEEKYRTIDENKEQGLSNEEYLSNYRSSSSLNSAYYSQNWNVSWNDDSWKKEYPSCMHDLITNITFSSFKKEEDTISAHNGLVIDADDFFSILDNTFGEIEKIK